MSNVFRTSKLPLEFVVLGFVHKNDFIISSLIPSEFNNFSMSFCRNYIALNMIHRRENDVKLLKSITRFYRFTGSFHLENKLVLTILLAFFLTGLAVSIVIPLYFFHNVSFSATGLFIYSNIMLLIVLFSFVCWREAWAHRSLWKNFFRDIEEFDNKMGGFKECTYKIYLKLMFGNIFYAIIMILSVLDPIAVKPYYVIFLSYHYIVFLQMFVTTSVLQMMLCMIERRYEYLKKKTAEVFLRANHIQEMSNKIQLKVLHLLLFNTSGRINKLFGRRILILLMITFLKFLGVFQYFLLEDIPILYTGIRQLFSNVATSVSFWIFSVSIINGCSRVEQKHNELLMDCAFLHSRIKEDEEREDLESIENYIRNLRPVFTAAGFFTINQRLFSTFCSTAVSYLIIIIQFKSVVSKIDSPNLSNSLNDTTGQVNYTD